MLHAPKNARQRELIVGTSASTETQLAALEQACEELARWESLQTVIGVRDQAEAFCHYARSAKVGLELLNKAAEFKLRAERRAGQLLAQMALRGGDRVSKAYDTRATLRQLDISYNQSSRWQRAALVPDEEFSRFLAAAREKQVELSTAALLRLATKLTKKRKTAERRQAAIHKPSPHTASDRSPRPEEILDELQNHCEVFEGILSPICESSDPVELPSATRNHVRRMLREFKVLIGDLKSHFGNQKIE